MNAAVNATITETLTATEGNLEQRGLEMTGQFLHETSKKHNLFFQSEGDVPRSITILAAAAYKSRSGDLDFSRNGIAIIDNDNWRIVSDGSAQQASGIAGASREQTALLTRLQAMEWPEFSAFCKEQAGYRVGSPDIDNLTALPACGNHANQTKLGIRNMRMEDYRNDFVRSLHDMGEYNLPLTTRDGMIRDLMVRNSTEVDGGRMLSWSTSMDFRWDRSGHIVGGEDLNQSYDENWTKALAEDASIMRRAVDAAFKPYFAEDFSVFDIGDEARVELVEGGEANDAIMLSTYRGIDMRFSDYRDLRMKISALQGDDLTYLWTTARALDRDLNRAAKIFDVSAQLNVIRAEMETVWSMELEDEVSFEI